MFYYVLQEGTKRLRMKKLSAQYVVNCLYYVFY